MLKLVEESPKPVILPDVGAQHYPRVGVFGLGYVGAVTGACLADSGFWVVGTDANEQKCARIDAGKAPMVEPGLDTLIAETTQNGILTTSLSAAEVIAQTDMSIVCVGTPSDDNGGCDLVYLKQVCADIGEALKTLGRYHVVVFRSTVPPGSVRGELLPILQSVSGKVCGKDFGVCFHPEFLREGKAIEDFHEPPKTVIGAFDMASAKPLDAIYKMLGLETIHTSLEVAEMVKYVDNSWHAVKVSFSNEIGRLSQAIEIDSHEVMDIFVQDTKLNLSPYYMIPGAPFGGSCLPKDVRGIMHLAHSNNVDLPILSNVLGSNSAQIEHTIELAKQSCPENGVIGFLGVTFKPHTDDLRESPILRIMASLFEQGYRIKFFDPNLQDDAPIAHQLEHTKHESETFRNFVKHMRQFRCNSAKAVMEISEVVVVSHKTDEFQQAIRHRNAASQVIDLVRLFGKTDAWPAAQQNGIDGYVPKPVNREQLVETLSKWVNPNQAPRVLIAEDEPVVAKVTQLMLERSGCQVEKVANGHDAVETARTGNFDVILMDINLPVKNGLEAAKEIRDLPGKTSAVPILAFSKYAAPEQSNSYTGICW